MKPNILRACCAGFVGTTIVTLLVYFVSPYLTGGPADLAALVVGMVGASWIAGMGAHFLIGTFVLPVLYALFLNGWLAGGAAVRGMTWGLFLWLVSQAIVIPTTGGGFFSSDAGGLQAILESLIGHLVYGLALGVLSGGPREGTSAAEREFHYPEPHARRAG